MNLESGAIRFANEKAEILPRNGRKTTEQVTRHAMPKIETTSTMHIDWVAFLLAVLNAEGVFLSQTTEKNTTIFVEIQLHATCLTRNDKTRLKKV